MMTARLSHLCILVLACTATYAGSPLEYKGGTGESVKNWGAKDYEQLQKSQLPLFIYITDEGYKLNQKAKLFENDLIGDAKVKTAMKPFSQIRMDTDGTHAKGWSKDWLTHGSNGAAILLISSDLRFPIWIDKATPKEQLKPDLVIKSMQMIVDYEAKKREAVEVAAKKDPKQKEAPEEKPKEEPTKGFAGFLGDKDKDKLPFPPKKDEAGKGKDDKVAADKKSDAPKMKKKDEPADE